MRHLANSARGRLAETQDDLLKIAMDHSTMQTESFEHPICETGFSEYGEDGFVRMYDMTFLGTILSILKSRPSAHLWDVVPAIPYEEVSLLREAPEGFRFSFRDKAQFLKDEFMRRPNMVGFKIELHGVSSTTDRFSDERPSLSISIYESVDALDDTCIPVSIKVKYRNNF